MKKAALYIRKSTKDKQKNSFAVQLSNMAQYCEGHFNVVKTFEDEMTGTTMNRPGLNEALEWLNSSTDHVLIVYKVDRLGRTIDRFEGLRSLIDAGQIKFMDMHSASERCDMMMVQLKLVFAEAESRQIGRRISSTIRHLQAQGVQWGQSAERMTEIRKLGHTKRGQKTDEFTIKLLAKIEKINPNGDKTLKQICEALNFFEILTPKGGNWTAPYLCQLMKRAEKRGLKAA